jgi:hypothetical protein
MRILLAAAIGILVLSNYARAQDAEDKPLTGPEEMEQKKRADAAEIEKAYKNTLKNTRSERATTSADPWGNIRSNQAPAAKNSK